MLDIILIDGKPILHIVDDSSHFSAARFLPDVTTKKILAKIVKGWASVCTGLPNMVRVDQGSQLRDSFIYVGRASVVQVNSPGIEAHNALRIGERYHHPLRERVPIFVC